MKRTNEFGLTGDQAEGRVESPAGSQPEVQSEVQPEVNPEEKTEEPKPIEEKKNE